jgi:hypothetical protein
LQKRIDAASLVGDVKRVRKLQKTLNRSWYNKMLSARFECDDRDRNGNGDEAQM